MLNAFAALRQARLVSAPIWAPRAGAGVSARSAFNPLQV